MYSFLPSYFSHNEAEFFAFIVVVKLHILSIADLSQTRRQHKWITPPLLLTRLVAVVKGERYFCQFFFLYRVASDTTHGTRFATERFTCRKDGNRTVNYPLNYTERSMYENSVSVVFRIPVSGFASELFDALGV